MLGRFSSSGTRPPPKFRPPACLYKSSAKERQKESTELTWSHVWTKQILLRTSDVWQQQKAWQEEFS